MHTKYLNGSCLARPALHIMALLSPFSGNPEIYLLNKQLVINAVRRIRASNPP
jgi:hypothetical protein